MVYCKQMHFETLKDYIGCVQILKIICNVRDREYTVHKIITEKKERELQVKIMFN